MLAIAGSVLHAQQPAQRRCGTTEYTNQLQATNPQYITNRQQIEDFTSQWIANNPQQAKSAAVITIPVVVHVVYKTNAENISDAQVLSQIPVLNKDYRRLNTDASNTPSVWQSIAADAGIEFCMASVDPNGNATNGIVRKSTTLSSFTDNDNVKFASSGGDDAWPSNKYLNIWVCNLTGGILGYATPPGFPADQDGVVIGYKYYGNTGTLDPVYNKGRTATHEIGHWLNLDHVWGDDGTSCNGTDNVADTPNQADENYGCPSFPTISCSNGPNGDMFMNYMDYADDACMNLFTTGQKTRMLACLNGVRSSILTSNGCGGSVVNPPGQCDTLTNVFNSDTLVLFLAQNSGNDAGYISGTNTYGDNAKADVFSNAPSGTFITGGLIGFGVAYTTNSSRKVTAAVWNTSGTAGSPGTELASKDILINSINVGGLTAFSFNSPPSAPSSFYMGIRWTGLSSTDSVAIYTSTDRGSNTAWERWSDNTWHSYTDANGWGFGGLSHVIFPVLCPTVGINEENNWAGVSVFPNPTDGNINVYLKLKNNDDIGIRVFNTVGQFVTGQNVNNTAGGTYNLDLTGQAPGLYFVEVKSGNISRTFKIVLTR